MATRDFLPATDGCHLREQHKYCNIVRNRWLKMEQTEAAGADTGRSVYDSRGLLMLRIFYENY